jgi:hypothetical protein
MQLVLGMRNYSTIGIASGKVLVVTTSVVNGDMRYKGQGYITSLNRSSPTEDSETFDVTIQGTGTISKYTVS